MVLSFFDDFFVSARYKCFDMMYWFAHLLVHGRVVQDQFAERNTTHTPGADVDFLWGLSKNKLGTRPRSGRVRSAVAKRPGGAL